MNFKISIHKSVMLAAMSLMALLLSNNAAAYSSASNVTTLLNSITALCSPNGTKVPLPGTGSCSTCHTSPPALTPLGAQYFAKDPALCNPPPLVAAISAPANNSTINLGTTVTFAGTATYSGTNLPLTYAWNFGGATANSTVLNPSVVLNTVGTFTVTFTVSDSKGLASTPATITLTVIDPNTALPPNGTITSPSGNVSINVGGSVSFAGTGTDPGNNTPLTYAWNFGGGAANSTLQNPTVTFTTTGIYTVTFTVTDSKGLSDPTPDSRTVTVATTTTASSCTDNDHDMFSIQGGNCGPIDCNDNNAAVNPGAIELCSDKIDNDCNGKIDSADPHCNGGECLAQLLTQIVITSASWEQDDSKLSVNGPWTTAGATVTLTDAITGTVEGTTTTTASGWSFTKENIAMAPCRVHVAINGRSGEHDVAYAPANCSGKPPATNKPPVANPDTVTTSENVPVSISVLANDTDPDGDTLRIVAFTQPAHGVVTQTPANGPILVYAPATGYYGSDSFTYTISDGHGGTSKATVSVTVVNRPPVANPDTATTTQNVPVNIAVLANDTDPENDTLSITGFTQPAHGVVTRNGLILTYKPASAYFGTDSFTYTISDGHGNTATGTVTVTVQKATSTPIKVVIGSATWNRSNTVLLVSGSGGISGASVKILNATTKALLGTTQSEDNGLWTIQIEKPSVVPCKVHVDITKGAQTGSAEKAVTGAPSTCK